MTAPAPDELVADISSVADAHRALAASLDGLDDATARRASRLPGWSVGHVLAHLARNAESLVRVLDDAAHGLVGVQYPAGWASRDADIETGSGRSAPELRREVAATSAALEVALAETSPGAWASGRAMRAGVEVPLSLLPLRRLQEVEIHRVDLGLGYEPADWDDRFVERQLGLLLPSLADRLPPEVTVELAIDDRPPVRFGTGQRPTGVRRSGRAVLHWLVGRSDDPMLPRLAGW